MNITVNNQVLAHELRLLSAAVPSKATLPILSHVLVVAGERLMLATTDLQITMSTYCPAQINMTGAVTLPAAKLQAILEETPDADVTLMREGDHVFLMTGVYKARLQTFSPTDFPKIPVVAGDVTQLPAASLAHLIERTTYAISERQGPYTMRGALLSFHENVFAMISTDGKRLSIATAALTEGRTFSTVIPAQSLAALEAHCAGAQEVAFSTDGKHLFFQAGDRLMTSHTLEGTFPSYETIIPKECTKHLRMNRPELHAGLRRVIVLADDGQPAIYFNISDGKMHMSTTSAAHGAAEEMISVGYEGEPFKFCLQGRFLLDFLEHATQPVITLDVESPVKPYLFTDGPDFINVILGMRA